MPPWELRKAPAHDIRKLAYWLPHHRDAMTLLMAKAIGTALGGKFTPEFEPIEEEKPTDPETVKATAHRELDKAYDRHARMIEKFRRKKARR